MFTATSTQRSTTRTNAVTVPTLGEVNNQWAAAAGADCLGPFNAGDPDTEQVRTRGATLLPQVYIRRVLGRTFTPHTFWDEVIVNGVLADNKAVEYESFLTWARVACVYPGLDANNAPQPPIATHNAFGTWTAPLSDDALRERVWSEVQNDLPGLLVAHLGVTQQILQQTELMRQATENQTTAAAAARAAAAAPKTIHQKFPELTDTLLRYCEVNHEDNLPPFWARFANTAKSEVLQLLTTFVDRRATSVESTRLAPVITPELVEVVRRLSFGADMDDLVKGLSVFLIVTRNNPQAATEAETRATAYTLTIGQHAAPSLIDIATLVPNSAHMPRTLLQCMSQYKAYSVLLDVLLGPDHRVLVAFRQLVTQLDSLQGTLENSLGSVAQTCAMLPHLLRHTHLVMCGYFNEAALAGTAATLPMLMELPRIVRMQQWTMLLPLPPRYTRAIGPGGVAATQPAPLQPQTGTPPRAPPVPPDGGGRGRQGPPSQPVTNHNPVITLGPPAPRPHYQHPYQSKCTGWARRLVFILPLATPVQFRLQPPGHPPRACG